MLLAALNIKKKFTRKTTSVKIFCYSPHRRVSFVVRNNKKDNFVLSGNLKTVSKRHKIQFRQHKHFTALPRSKTRNCRHKIATQTPGNSSRTTSCLFSAVISPAESADPGTKRATWAIVQLRSVRPAVWGMIHDVSLASWTYEALVCPAARIMIHDACQSVRGCNTVCPAVWIILHDVSVF